MNWKCLFGVHKWIYFTGYSERDWLGEGYYDHRRCPVCKTKQKLGSGDCYPGEDWEELNVAQRNIQARLWKKIRKEVRQYDTTKSLSTQRNK